MESDDVYKFIGYAGTQDFLRDEAKLTLKHSINIFNI